jgi:hypothetical protein
MVIGGLLVGGAIAGGLVPVSSPTSADPDETLLTAEEVLIGAGVGLGAMFLGAEFGSQVGTPIATSIIGRNSRRQELDADAYAIELLWAAGYDHRAPLCFLMREGQGVFEER